MSSVNRQSLREEFTALQERFGQLSADGKLGAESRALIEALLMLLSVLMAVFMEKNTPKSSTNSSQPSSRTPKDESALGHAGTHPKGQAYDPSRPANTRTVETVQVSKVGFCEACGEDLRNVRPDGHERRTRIDIVFEKVVSHVDAEIKSCPHCGSETRAPFPETFSGPVQYGSGIQAYALNLLMAQMISLQRVQHSIQSEYNTPRQTRERIRDWFIFYNAKRRHQSLDYPTPWEVLSEREQTRPLGNRTKDRIRFRDSPLS